jgi:DNA polymerase-3 subunit beta
LKFNSKKRLEVTSGKAKFSVAECRNGEDFPPPKEINKGIELEISEITLRRLIEETVFSIVDNERAGLNGAHMEFDGEGEILRMITTDGNRLSLSEGKLMSVSNNPGDGSLEQLFNRMLIPKKALLEIRKLCEEDETTWKICFGNREANFSNATLSLMVNLVDGQFPDYRPVLNSLMSKVDKREAKLLKKSLQNVFRRVSIFTSKTNNAVVFDFKSDGLVLSTNNPDFGEFNEDIDLDFDGAPIKVAFNLKYFQDILNAVDGEFLSLELGDVLDPCIVKLSNRTDCQFVIMPMRLN